MGKGKTARRRARKQNLSPRLSHLERAAICDHLRAWCPSADWVDVFVSGMERRGISGRNDHLRTALIHAGLQPRGWLRCPICGRWCPPTIHEGRVLCDCQQREGSDRSPSAAARQRLEDLRGRVRKIKLEPEGDRALAREIRKTSGNRKERTPICASL